MIPLLHSRLHSSSCKLVSAHAPADRKVTAVIMEGNVAEGEHMGRRNLQDLSSCSRLWQPGIGGLLV